MEIWSEKQAFSAFDEMLDNTEGLVKVCGCNFWPSVILKELDPASYEEQACIWFENMADEFRVEGYTQ